MIPTFQSTCLSKVRIAPGVYELRLEKPVGFVFKPGQFVLFDVPLLEDDGDIQARAYSLASSPSETDLLFLIKLVPHGRASKWIEERVVEGTIITMKGPFGVFLLDTETEKPYLFIATGTGIAPLRSQIHWLLKERKDSRRMQLLFGVLRESDLFWMDEWKSLEHDHHHLQVQASIFEKHGPMQEQIANFVENFGNISIYICGAPAMVQDVKSRCLHWGVPKSDIHAESYI